MTRAENTAALQKQPGHGALRRNEAGWHNAEWRLARIAEAAEMGHDLQFFGPDASLARRDTQTLRFTCPKCKRLCQCSSDFIWKPCEPRDYPRPPVWYQLRKGQEESLPRLVNIWKWGRSQLKHIDALALKPSSRRTVPREVAMAPITDSQWVQDLTEHGDVEPNPGPRSSTMRKKSSLCVFTLNCGGAQNVWKVFQDIGQDDALDVIALQELSMDKKQMNTFAAAAFKHGWTCFFTLGRPSQGPGIDRRVGGVCTLVRKGIPCTSWCPKTEAGGEAVAVQFGTTTLINCYANVTARLRQPL
eukprot:Skav212713  [mRNA]  locus=scaffold113:244139:245044:- [translate_table: standard]